MGTQNLDQIGTRLATARSKLLAALCGLEAVAWDWDPGDGRWSVRLTLAHVGSAQRSHLAIARRLASGQAVELPGFDLDAWNAAEVEKRADWSVGEVLADLELGHQEAMQFLESLDLGQLAISGHHPALGMVSVEQVLRVIAVHDKLHLRDIHQLILEMGGKQP
jgi:hypothetical protein